VLLTMKDKLTDEEKGDLDTARRERQAAEDLIQ